MNEGDKDLKKEASQLFTDNKKINRKEVHDQLELEVIHFLDRVLIK